MEGLHSYENVQATNHDWAYVDLSSEFSSRMAVNKGPRPSDVALNILQWHSILFLIIQAACDRLRTELASMHSEESDPT